MQRKFISITGTFELSKKKSFIDKHEYNIDYFRLDNIREIYNTNYNKEVVNNYFNNLKESKIDYSNKHLRSLALPQASKTVSTTIDYANSDYEKQTNYKIRGSRAFVSKENPNYLLYSEYRKSDKYVRLVVLKYTQTSSSGGYDKMYRQYDRKITFNECSTKPASGNEEIWTPFAYIYYGGKDYVAFILNYKESGGKCINKYSLYFIYVSNYCCDSNPGNFNNYISSSSGEPSTGITPFYNPNTPILGENLGLATFTGYTKCVELTFQLSGANPVGLALVYYEDTNSAVSKSL